VQSRAWILASAIDSGPNHASMLSERKNWTGADSSTAERSIKSHEHVLLIVLTTGDYPKISLAGKQAKLNARCRLVFGAIDSDSVLSAEAAPHRLAYVNAPSIFSPASKHRQLPKLTLVLAARLCLTKPPPAQQARSDVAAANDVVR